MHLICCRVEQHFGTVAEHSDPEQLQEAARKLRDQDPATLKRRSEEMRAVIEAMQQVRRACSVKAWHLLAPGSTFGLAISPLSSPPKCVSLNSACMCLLAVPSVELRGAPTYRSPLRPTT